MTTKDPTNLSSVPLKSKKFLAYLIADIGWKILMFYVVWEYKTQIDHYAFMVLVTMIVTSGFIQIGYILGQAALDKYTHVATTALEQNGGGGNKPPSPKKPTPPAPKPTPTSPNPDSVDPDEFM